LRWVRRRGPSLDRGADPKEVDNVCGPDVAATAAQLEKTLKADGGPTPGEIDPRLERLLPWLRGLA
jgi:hypothetical protein